MIDMNKLDINALRKEFKEGDGLRDSGLVEPKTITAIKNIPYGPHGTDNLLDVYYPNDQKTPLPTIINIHGGGFFYGDKELYRFYTMGLAERGFCVVNFNYRLAPEHKYPAPLEDINNVIIWMLSQIEHYPFDFTNLFLVGDSAGGQLAEQYAAIIYNNTYAKFFDFTAPAITIKGLGLNCGAYFLGTENNPIDNFSFYIDSTYQNHFPVENYITSDFPAASITTASHDFLKDLAQPLSHVLEEKGVQNVLTVYENADKEPLEHVFHIGQKKEISKLCNDEQMAFFKSLI